MVQKLNRNWLSVENVEFDKFWSEHLKISKICTLMDCFWSKYTMFEPKKKYRGFMFDGTEYWCKIWRKNDLNFQNWHAMTYFSWKTKHHISLLFFSFFLLCIFLKIISQFCISKWSIRRKVFDKFSFSARHLCYLCNIFNINLHFTTTTFYGSSCEKFVFKNNNRFWS